MTVHHVVFVCEDSPGIARLAAQIAMTDDTANDAIDAIDAIGGPVTVAGFVPKRLADAASREGYDLDSGHVSPIEYEAVERADVVVAFGSVPTWIETGRDVRHWGGAFVDVAGPAETRIAVEQLTSRVTRFLDAEFGSTQRTVKQGVAASSDD